MTEFVSPTKSDVFTIYSKSGCPNCRKVKDLVKLNNFDYVVIDCDEWLIEQKQEFIAFLSKLAKNDIKYFPVVFEGLSFIGGFEETKKYIEELNEYKI